VLHPVIPVIHPSSPAYSEISGCAGSISVNAKLTDIFYCSKVVIGFLFCRMRSNYCFRYLWRASRSHRDQSSFRAVCLALQSLTQLEIASKWEPKPISQQAVHKHFQNAGWPAIEPALNWIATTIKGCNAKNNLGDKEKRKSSS